MTAAVIPERPFLKPWYRLARHDGGTVLEYGHVAVVFEGRATERLLPALLPLLDGTHPVSELLAALGEAAAPAVRNALALLARHRLLTEGAPPGEDGNSLAAETARFLSALAGRELPPHRIAGALAAARVAVVGSGPVADRVARLLHLSGLGAVERGSTEGPAAMTELAVVAPDGPESPDVVEWNRAALAARAPWLAVLPFDGRFATVGPLFVPSETACYECYRIRRASHLEYPEEFWVLERCPRTVPTPAAFVAALAGLAVTVALRWLVERDAALPGVMLAFEPAGVPRLSMHHVYRVPRCPVCSDAERIALAAPWFDGELLA